MSYIYIINDSDDPQATMAVYKKLDDVTSINIHAWMTAYLPRGSRARLTIGDTYGVFISYQNPNGQILYESEIIPITDDERYFSVTRTRHEISLVRMETPPGATEVFVNVEKKVGRYITVNIVRDNQVYYSLGTSPGCSQELTIDYSLYLTKVRPEVMQGKILEAREILIPPSQIYPGQTAILSGDLNQGYEIDIRDVAYTDFINI